MIVRVEGSREKGYTVTAIVGNRATVGYSAYVNDYDVECGEKNCRVTFRVDANGYDGVKLLFEAVDADDRGHINEYLLTDGNELWWVIVRSVLFDDGVWRYFVEVDVYVDALNGFVKVWSYEINDENDYDNVAEIGLAPLVARDSYTLKDVEDGFARFLKLMKMFCGGEERLL